MRRVAIYSIRAVVVIALVVGIVWLKDQVLASVKELSDRAASRGLYSEHSASFGPAATAIQQHYTQVIFQQTHAPTGTEAASDNTDNAANTSSVDQTVPEATIISPTLSVASVSTASGGSSEGGAPVRAAQAATLPPTNTKRPSATPQAATATPTVIPPTVTPTTTSTETPTGTPTAVSVTSTQVVPTIGATSKLPTVVLPAKRTEKPQPTGIPTNAPRVKANGNDIMNILVIGTDQDVDPSDPTFRTDTMIIVSINRTTNTVAMLSIPRDLFVYIPSLGMQRINTAFSWGESVKWSPGGGFGLLQATILYNLGIPVHYYAMVSFDGFKKIVDTLNGIDIAVDCPISDLRFQGKYDAQKTPVYEPYTLNPGYYHMDGSFSLWYARMRISTSDPDRNRRQQQVLRAIWRTARDQGLITKAPELWGQVTGIVKTDLQLPDVLGLAPLALSMKPGEVTSYVMYKGYQTQHWSKPATNSAPAEDVQLPDPKGFFQTINDFYTPPTANRLGAQQPTIEIVNGSTNKDWDKVAADALTWDGFDVQDKGAGDSAAKTTLYDLTGSAKPGALQNLVKALNVKPGQVVSQPDPNRTVDFRVVLGGDYNSCTAPGFSK